MSKATDIEKPELDLRSIKTFAQAAEAWEQTYRANEILGDGFTAIKDDEKAKLIETPFYLVKFQLVTEDKGEFGEFVVCWVVTKDDQRLRFSDGGVGIKEQLKGFQAETGQQGGMACPRGLTASDYTFTDKDGKEKPARTYYIAES